MYCIECKYMMADNGYGMKYCKILSDTEDTEDTEGHYGAWVWNDEAAQAWLIIDKPQEFGCVLFKDK